MPWPLWPLQWLQQGFQLPQLWVVIFVAVLLLVGKQREWAEQWRRPYEGPVVASRFIRVVYTNRSVGT